MTDFGKTRLVYAERHEEIEATITREKLVKKWRRQWKFAPIEADILIGWTFGTCGTGCGIAWG